MAITANGNRIATENGNRESENGMSGNIEKALPRQGEWLIPGWKNCWQIMQPSCSLSYLSLISPIVTRLMTAPKFSVTNLLTSHDFQDYPPWLSSLLFLFHSFSFPFFLFILPIYLFGIFLCFCPLSALVCTNCTTPLPLYYFFLFNFAICYSCSTFVFYT